MPCFTLCEEGWFTRSYVIENECGKELFFIESNASFWKDDFIVRRMYERGEFGSRIAVMEGNTESFGPYSYDITVEGELVASVTDIVACCGPPAFVLQVFGGKHHRRTFYLDKASLFGREFEVIRHDRHVATYYRHWLSPHEIDVDDDIARTDAELTQLLIFSCVIMERITTRKRRSQHALQANP